MTLNEAYELQRREVISLRAKVARLEKQVSGLFPIEEKEKPWDNTTNKPQYKGISISI